MGFFKSIGDIASAMSNANKNENDDSQVDAVANTREEIQFSAKINKLIDLILEDGELNEEERDMLIRVAEKEGLDPDEVLFVVKKKLKLSQRGEGRMRTADPKASLSPAKRLAYEVAEIDKKFDAAIEAIYAGDDSAFGSVLDTLTGGVSGLAVGIGKKLFMKSDDEKVMELEQQRETQISRVVSSVTTPSDFPEFMELLEYVSNQSQQRDEDSWDDVHLALSKRGLVMAGDDEKKKEYLNMYIHESFHIPKGKNAVVNRTSAIDIQVNKPILTGAYWDFWKRTLGSFFWLFFIILFLLWLPFVILKYICWGIIKLPFVVFRFIFAFVAWLFMVVLNICTFGLLDLDTDWDDYFD